MRSVRLIPKGYREPEPMIARALLAVRRLARRLASFDEDGEDLVTALSDRAAARRRLAHAEAALRSARLRAVHRRLDEGRERHRRAMREAERAARGEPAGTPIYPGASITWQQLGLTLDWEPTTPGPAEPPLYLQYARIVDERERDLRELDAEIAASAAAERRALYGGSVAHA